ncbi:unnamed protein product [Protopolystoma xenopodis]|uniref:SH3 domain-containing protein n=1 Tax=Protopolystoma xenopodis TaxID=117903 RepID=A0A448WYT9_9PLAT|nr:unnamed protein product [Protopolystoma xenopodis]
MLPRLAPEIWRALAEYRPSNDLRAMEELNQGRDFESTRHNELIKSELHSSFRQRLALKAGELVCVLSKKDPELWKVASQITGKVGYVPTPYLKQHTTHLAGFSSSSISIASDISSDSAFSSSAVVATPITIGRAGSSSEGVATEASVRGTVHSSLDSGASGSLTPSTLKPRLRLTSRRGKMLRGLLNPSVKEFTIDTCLT